MAIWTGVRPFRFSSLNAPVNSFPNREVNKGSKGVWPAEQTQWSKLLPRWSVRFRIKVDSKPSVTSSCEKIRDELHIFFRVKLHIFGRFRTAEKIHFVKAPLLCFYSDPTRTQNRFNFFFILCLYVCVNAKYIFMDVIRESCIKIQI